MKERYVLDPVKLKKAAIAVLIIIIGLFMLYKSLYYFAPFIIAFLLSSLMEPLIKLMVNKCRFPRALAAFISLILVLGLLGYIISLAVSKALYELKGVLTVLPQYFSDAYRNFTSLNAQGHSFISGLPDEVSENVGGIISSLLTHVTNILNTFAKSLLSTAISLPGVLVFVLTTILSTYFLASSRYEIAGFFKRHLPEDWYNKFYGIRTGFFNSGLKLIKAYLLIMSITFTELLIGFSVIRLKYAFILAVTIAIIDILPILGTGGVVIPWALYNFITGNTRLGLYLMILYAIILIIRQIIEPKIIGHQIGTHPLVTLMAMYLGLKIIGAAGLLLGPITILILKSVLSSILKGRTMKDILFKKVTY